MARLIEVQRAQGFPQHLPLRVGDLLLFRASGGHVQSGSGVIERLGPFISAVVGDHGEVLSPMGPPNATLFLVRGPGEAIISVVTGDPWYAPQTSMLHITVEP
jgi:hypothetical protein